jgi:hypothetical protein
MARLPILHRRRSKSDQVLDTVKSVAQIWTTLKLGAAAAGAAKGGAKAYGTAKSAKLAGRPVLKLLIVPVAVVGGVVVWRKLSASSGDDVVAPAPESTLGPVATAEAVSPPEAPKPPAGPSPSVANETT